MDDVDKEVHDFIVKHDAYPSAIDFMHFPKSVCTSVNEVVSHGVPNSHLLVDGDYLNIDVTCYLDGFHGDNSGMVFMGDVHEDIQRLAQVTREAMFKAIYECGPGVPFSMIGEVIEEYAKEFGYFVNQEFGGHGIGRNMHQAPMVYHHKTRDSTRAKMEPGNSFTIEPILMMWPLHVNNYI